MMGLTSKLNNVDFVKMSDLVEARIGVSQIVFTTIFLLLVMDSSSTVINYNLSQLGYSVQDDLWNEEELFQTQTAWEIPLNQTQFDLVLKKYPVVVVNFYVPWAPWCQRLAPSWDAAAAEMHQRYPDQDGSIRFAKVDCTEEPGLCRYHFVMGYPGIRVFRDGKDVVKVGDREEHEAYHGFNTNKDALLEFFESTIAEKHKVEF